MPIRGMTVVERQPQRPKEVPVEIHLGMIHSYGSNSMKYLCQIWTATQVRASIKRDHDAGLIRYTGGQWELTEAGVVQMDRIRAGLA